VKGLQEIRVMMCGPIFKLSIPNWGAVKERLNDAAPLTSGETPEADPCL
jgi:hypothetical protein